MPTLSGSLNVTGSVNVTGSFTLNGNIVTSGTITSNGPNTFNGNVIVTGSLTATGGVTASLQGSASHALTATSANNIQITDTTSSLGGPFYPVFTATNNGYGGALVDTSIFIYTPTTNTLSVNIAGNVTGSLTGSLLGTSSYATRAVAGDKIKAANIAGSGILFPLLGSSFTGDVNVFSIQSTDYKYDLSTNQLIASSISASFTGSLLGTAATASNITPAIASDGVNRVLTSDGDGTVTAEANFTFNGTSALLTGSLTVSGSGTLTNIGPAIFRGNTANSATATALEITGGLQVSHSIDSVNRYLYNETSNIPVLQWGPSNLDLKLVDVNTNTSVLWGARTLFDENGLTSIDWTAANSYAPRTLLDASELASVKWGLRQLLYSSGSTAFNWGTPDKIFMSGSVIVTGSLNVTSGITGSLLGTSSYATRAVAGDKIKAANVAGSGILFPLLGSSFTGDVNVFSIQSTDYKYNLSTNQLIASSISASFTGSLLGTASFAVTASYALSSSFATSASYAPASSPYLVYTALLSLSSGTFTVTQLENTIGNGSNTSPDDIQWSNPSNGVIRGQMSGAFSDTTNMIIFTPSIRPSGVSYFVAGGLGSFMSGSLQYAPTLTIARHDNDLSSTPNFNDLPIEIRVYN